MNSAAKILLAAAVTSAGWYYFTLYRPEHAVEDALQRKYRDELKEAQKQIDAGKKDDGLATYGIAALQHQGDIQKINNPLLAIPRNCPDGPKIEGNVFTFDLTACAGRNITRAQLVLPRSLEHFTHQYKVELLTKDGGELRQQPHLEPIKDGFSQALLNRDGTWTLREDIVLTPIRGDVIRLTPLG